MARTAQTRTAVLGALSVEPMTGYAVRAAIGALQYQHAGQPGRTRFQPAKNLSCRLFIERVRIGYLDGTFVHRT